MAHFISRLVCSLVGKSGRNGERSRANLRVERLDDRIVPSAPTTTWQAVGMSSAWGIAANWSNGVPDSTKVALFNQSANGCTLSATTTVAGLWLDTGWNNTLTLNAPLTISSLSGDNTTGFKMAAGLISQTALGNSITITGGGDDSFNTWSGGSIDGTAQSNIYINGQSTLLITEGATTLGDNIFVGNDNGGGSTLELKNQTITLSVVNNAGIQICDTTDDLALGPNQLLFNGDTTPVGKVPEGLSTTSSTSFIDNYGTIVRSNAGIFDTGLPIKNEGTTGRFTATLDVQSNLSVSGNSATKTAGYGVDQEGGNTIIENGKTLSVAGFLMNAGQLLTYGTANATINAPVGYSGTYVVNVTGGTMEFSADNTAQYGSLTVVGNMSWTGGTFQCYINGGTAGQQSQLIESSCTLTLGAGAHLHLNVNGTTTSTLTWVPVNSVNMGATSGQLTFDNSAQFTIPNPNPGTQISVTSR